MPIRRLIILFSLLTLAAVVLILRLGQLQIVQAEQWKSKARIFMHRPQLLETNRGSILDRNGHALAQDEPCNDLAIDYRAMSYDDSWIESLAIRRLKQAGISDRRQRIAMLSEAKAQIVDQIDAIPQAIAEACNLPLEDVLARMDNIRARIDALRQNLSRRYDRQSDAQTIASGLYEPESEVVAVRDEYAFHTIVAAVPDAIVFALNKKLDQYPGLRCVPSLRRNYPYKDVAAHVIGVLRPVYKEDFVHDKKLLRDPIKGPGEEARPLLARFETPEMLVGEGSGNLRGYLPGDRLGSGGIEGRGEDFLRGTRGMQLRQIGGEEIRDQRREPIPGKTLRLTLDAELQRDLQKAILNPARELLLGEDRKPHHVVLVILGLDDGQLYTLLTTPTYDLTAYEQNKLALVRDEMNLPLMNRPISAAYPPGSIVKPFVATAALTQQLVTPEETIVCNGALDPAHPGFFRCDGIHHAVQLTRGLEFSCNVYFYTMGSRLGLPDIVRWYRAFGFGATTGLGLGEETRGALVDPAALQSRSTPRELKNMATMLGIGQGPLAVTPLQVAQAYATLLRGGTVIPPRLLLDDPGAPGRKFDIPAQHLQTVRTGMELVVTEGTGKGLSRLRIPIAGKTGSATDFRPAFTSEGQRVPDLQRPWDGRGPKVSGPDGKFYKQAQVEGTDAWFAGYVPADNPKFVIVAFMEFGGHGGVHAVPLIREAVLQLERHDYLPALDVP